MGCLKDSFLHKLKVCKPVARCGRRLNVTELEEDDMCPAGTRRMFAAKVDSVAGNPRIFIICTLHPALLDCLNEEGLHQRAGSGYGKQKLLQSLVWDF